MLLSMTGHGDARHQADGLGVFVEIRTVNSRYFKLLVRGPETYAGLESRIEACVRQHVRRGTVNVSLRMERTGSADDYRVNGDVLMAYRQQLQELGAEAIDLDRLLQLPGAVEEPRSRPADLEDDWKVIEPALQAAIKSLDEMRRMEGAATSADLTANCRMIAAELEKIEILAPVVVENYQVRLKERIAKLMAEYDITAAPADVIREVGIFSERCDISEEIVRLRSHLEQFDRIAEEKESTGRKLDFLIQEMFRETNTIGSKANDARIAMHVVEIKTCIERMREQIQNVE